MRKIRKHEEHENHERWLVSYADFITLLFAFFVIMYATSSNDLTKQQKFEESVRKELKLGLIGSGSSKSNAITEALLDLGQPISQFPQKAGPVESADYMMRALNKAMTAEEKKEAIQSIRHDSVGVRISLTASHFFQTGSYKLKRTALKELEKVAQLLKQTDRRIIIEGHTDDIPVKSDEVDSNWQLASLRATSVLRYLTQIQNISPSRLVVVSYADQKPLVPNNSEENRAKNRRVEILLVSDEKQNPLE